MRDAFGARPGCDAGGPCAGGRAAWSICSVIERFRRDALISELIEVAHDGSVATVVLNRPEKLNSPTKPMWRLLVAQIHGICVGGGLVIAALCDLRICGTSSRFGAPIENLGLVMAYPEMAPLLGERTREVLRGCGYADADIDGFVAAGVLEASASAR